MGRSDLKITVTNSWNWVLLAVPTLALIGVTAGCGGGSSSSSSTGLPLTKATLAQVTSGQAIVTSFGCTDCHNRGVDNTADTNWMAGYIGAAGGTGSGTYNIGPFQTYAANLTPDTTTGIGRYSDNQIYNALKYGLDPAATADVTITSTTPGQGNFPATPHYLAPPMPWPAIRHLSDTQLWEIIAYLKHGIKAVNNPVPASAGPPDFWASSYTTTAVGPVTIAAYPSGNEVYAP